MFFKNHSNKLSEDEIKILNQFAIKNGARNIGAYVRVLISNGDYIEIIKNEKRKQELKQKAEAQKQSEYNEIYSPKENTEADKQKINNLIEKTKKEIKENRYVKKI